MRIQPLNKFRWQCPCLGIAQHQFTQRFAVVINQLARNNDPAFIRGAVKMAEALKQQPRQLRRIAQRRRILEAVTGVPANPRLGGVGEDKTHLRIMCQFQKLIVLAVNADLTIYRADKARFADRLALLIQTTNDRGIQTILSA